MVERSNLILYLAGYYTGKHPEASSDDIKIMIDQHFLRWNNPPMQKEEMYFIDELYEEVMFTMNVAGLGRKEIRKFVK